MCIRDRAKDISHVTVSLGAATAEEGNKPTAAKPLRIALIGHNGINSRQADYCCAAFQKQLKAVLENKAQYGFTKEETPFVEFITPLAPGSDIVLARSVVKMETLSELVTGYRLTVPMAVPWDEVDEDFRGHWQNENVFDKKLPDPGNEEDRDWKWKACKEQLVNIREKLIDQIQADEQTVNIVNLMPEGNDILTNHQGYIEQAKWMVDQADVLIAVLDSTRKREQPGEWSSGGTGVTVAQWNADAAEDAGTKHKAFAVEINPDFSGNAA